MMIWLLLILKILGILIAVIFGTLLIVLLLLLFVPFCYHAKVCYGPQQLTASAGISWLLFVLRAKVSYLGQKPVILIARVFGIPVYRSDKEKKPKKKKESSPQEKRSKQKKKESKQAKKQVPSKQEIPKTDKPPKGLQENNIAEREEPEENSQQKTEQKKGIFARITDKIRKLRETIYKVWKKFLQILHRIDAVKEILSKEENKKTLAFAWAQLKHLFLHILPRKISGTLVYGSGDPCSTGQALGVLAVLYARYGELLSVQPDFEQKRLECDIELKGRIQLFVLLCLTVKVIRNKEARQLIHEFQNIKTIE